MLPSEIANQYLSTSDNDLKYMALRQELTVTEVDRELDSFVKKVLLPTLLEERDPQIVELVSSQVYPQLTLKCIDVMKRRNHEPQWFNGLIMDPLMKHMKGNRRNFFVQTLRNVLKVAVESCYRVGSVDDKYLKSLLVQMKEYEEENDVGQNIVLYWELLNYVILTYYGITAKICYELLHEIFGLCVGRLDALVRSVLISSIEVTSRENAEKIVLNSVTDEMLEVISNVWWQFGRQARLLLEDRLLPALSTEQRETTLTILKTIFNLSPYFHIETAQDGTRILDDSLLGRINARVQEILENASNKVSTSTAKLTTESELDVEDAEIDDAQQAYLDELKSDDDLEFEDDEQLLENEDDDQLNRLCTLILDALRRGQPKGQTRESQLVDLSKVKVGALTETDQTLDVVYTVKTTLDSDATLPELLLAVEVFNQLLLTGSTEVDYDPACQALVRHMKQNKAFLQTIKVGNMTQTIDEGSTLRTMVYSTIFEIITTRDLKYTTCCLMLTEAVSRGVRDVDPTINTLSLKIIETLLQSHYNTIRAVDPTWYNKTLLPKTIETVTKLHKRLKNTPEDSEHDELPIATALQAFTSLFMVQYPAIE